MGDQKFWDSSNTIQTPKYVHFCFAESISSKKGTAKFGWFLKFPPLTPIGWNLCTYKFFLFHKNRWISTVFSLLSRFWRQTHIASNLSWFYGCKKIIGAIGKSVGWASNEKTYWYLFKTYTHTYTAYIYNIYKRCVCARVCVCVFSIGTIVGLWCLDFFLAWTASSASRICPWHWLSLCV